jgi:hypothetical protein
MKYALYIASAILCIAIGFGICYIFFYTPLSNSARNDTAELARYREWSDKLSNTLGSIETGMGVTEDIRQRIDKAVRGILEQSGKDRQTISELQNTIGDFRTSLQQIIDRIRSSITGHEDSNTKIDGIIGSIEAGLSKLVSIVQGLQEIK